MIELPTEDQPGLVRIIGADHALLLEMNLVSGEATVYREDRLAEAAGLMADYVEQALTSPPTPSLSEQFTQTVNSAKVECAVCGRRGYRWPEYPDGPPAYARWWATSCIRGHSPCPDCGRQLSVRKNGEPRIHSRCPGRTTS